ncbi:MAG: arginine:pyruvate transaminase [Gammaproteobacteria bacterium]|jgi:arginine:pyruvate transaminase
MSNVSSDFRPFFSQVSKRLDQEAAPAWQIHDRAMARKQRGDNVIVLSIGDPDFRTPEPIVDNAISHLRVGRTHYSPAAGELNLRRAVADYESRISPMRCDVDEVTIYPGVTSAIYSVLNCLLDAGDEIVTLDPCYVGYEPIFNGLNLNVRKIITEADRGFIPRLEDFTNAITDQTRLVFLNTPGNPTGAMIPAELLADLADYCFDKNIWLVSDEVYSMFTYEKRHVSLRTAATRLDNIVVIDGLSKSHAMSGWRMGWVMAPTHLSRHLEQFLAMSTFGCVQFIQDAAAFALNNDEYYVRDMCNTYRERRDRVCRLLDDIPDVKYHKPESGMFIMVDITAFDDDDNRFAGKLLDLADLSMLPGSAFGTSTQGHLRLSLVQPENILVEGCQRLAQYISDV